MLNLDPNTNQGPTIIIVGVVFSFLAALAVALRFYARRIKGLRLGADDYVLLPALLFTVGVCADGIVGAIYGGIGQHMQALSPHTITVYQQIMFALQILYTLTLPLIKLSILLLYRRMFSTPSFNRVVTIIATFIFAWWIAFTLASILQCTPIALNWDRTLPGSCTNFLIMYWVHALTNIASDILILSLPWPMIWRLQMHIRLKVALSGMFLLGGLVCIASIIRFISILHLGPIDSTYTATPAVIWTCTEPCLGIISACLPTFRPLFLRLRLPFPSVRSKAHEELELGSEGREMLVRRVGSGAAN